MYLRSAYTHIFIDIKYAYTNLHTCNININLHACNINMHVYKNAYANTICTLFQAQDHKVGPQIHV